MSPAQVDACIDAVLKLSMREQACCVLAAAEMSLPAWQRWCRRKRRRDPSGPLIECFHRWLKSKASAKELDEIASQLQDMLPDDLPTEKDPSGGMAWLGAARCRRYRSGPVRGRPR